ncbi:MAG: D-3-phosphoglycerate dehydrogenase / 2-oxoglutarate reductase [Clostridiales bacterium]|jgi:D-3-phosphoglycerate dehydrogenase|nr:D-3-phosphoglycerate dehydrogenase / 2-oxoglutarate reductase [Clostridiales bacterium]
MKILVAEKIAEQGVQFLKDKGFDVDVDLKMDRATLLERIADYDALIVRSVTKVNEELYSHAKNLKVVGRAGNGVDNIEMEGATKRGIIIVNTPDSNTVSAAEHTIALLLSMCRNIPRANAHIREGNWDRSLFTGVELKGKTIGIVGLGRIGSMVATRMKSFEMHVIAYDPYIRKDRFEKLGVDSYTDLHEMIKACDFLTVHTPKTPETLGIIGAEEFAVAKKGLRVVNCARGGIISEDALYEAIEKGIVAGAAIDVLLGEPHPTSPLLNLDQTVLTPHLGADTVEAQINVGETVAEEVYEALKGRLVSNAVNLPTLNAQELDQLMPYLELSEKLGKIYYQIRKTPVSKVELIYKGEVAKFNTAPLTLGFIRGLFDKVLDGQVNYVNAKLVADSQNILVSEGKELTAGNYSSSIQANLNTNGASFTIEGALFGKNELRIVNLDGYAFDVTPMQSMILLENLDRPGMIGKIGQRLGEEGINISTMNVSIAKDKGTAMMFLTVDKAINKEVLSSIQSIDGVENAWHVSL